LTVVLIANISEINFEIDFDAIDMENIPHANRFSLSWMHSRNK